MSAALDSLAIGFVGAGRLGKALAWSLASAGLRVTCVASEHASEAGELAARIPGCESTDAQAVADRCDLVFITTPDGVIAHACSAIRWRPGTSVVHCSGATEVQALAHAASQGARIGGFHPMQTFGDPHAAVASLPGSTVTIEAAEPLNGHLVAIAERLQCRVNRLPPGMRARYHAAAGFTSQFVNVLFAQAAQAWTSWGATEEDVVRAMAPLVRGTLASIESAGIAGGMPGPVSRGDLGSVEKHLEGLADLGPGMLEFYRVMCRSTVDLAHQHGTLDGAAARQFRQVLEPA
jgi:predicted short-subunit dehydrogenase-like oxidoreductase (DUF2520 family)